MAQPRDIFSVVTDLHGGYKRAEDGFDHMPSVVGGIKLFTLGDNHGPENIDLLRKNSGDNFFEDLYQYPLKGEAEKQEAEDFARRAYEETRGIADVLENHPKIDIQATLSGNGEQAYEQYIPHFGDYDSPRQVLIESNINFTEMPDVKLYKDGEETDGENGVDIAFLMLPYILPKEHYNKIQRAFGNSESDMDFEEEAMKILTSSDGLLDRIKKANPKYIVQLQHELPKKELYERFGEPKDPHNKEIYEVVMEELSRYADENGKKYTILFGHLEHGGRFKRTITHKGRRIKVIHIDEGGKDILYIDSKTGKIYEAGEVPEFSEDDLLSDNTLDEYVEEEPQKAEEEAEETEEAEAEYSEAA